MSVCYIVLILKDKELNRKLCLRTSVDYKMGLLLNMRILIMEVKNIPKCNVQTSEFFSDETVSCSTGFAFY